jgi:enoyl-CoA hydratase/carnithine racemase
MSARLVRAVGITRARELSFTARTITGREAYEYGLASHCVALEQLDAKVAEVAETLVANSPEALAAYKDLYNNSQDRGLSDALQFEYDADYPMSGAGARLGTFGR